ncbi:MAG: right-handed parallel beta-helix repeat-containing protein [Polyangiaceae bacterium]|nr:right-handed parallel beta-helix repeat-containing protein [Polyangiaceae bacterium]
MRTLAYVGTAALLFVAATAHAETYVVAPGGSDSNSGLSGSPWATLQHAADTVVAGDTVIVEPGDYAGFYVTKSGTAGSPITFSAKLGTVIVSENDQTGQDGINIEDTENGETIAYVVVEGFTVNGMARAGIRTAVSSHITIRKNIADGNGSWGILTGFADDVLIEYNECSNSVDEHGIYVSNSGDRPVIRNNVLWGNNANGIHMNGDVSLGGDGTISNALVENNIIYDNGLAGGSGINCDGVEGSRIQNNLIYNTHASGISLYQIDGAIPSQNNVVVNNTILVASNGRWALNIREGAVGNKVFNNILLNAHSFRGAIDIAADALAGFESNNNLMIDRFTLDGDAIINLTEWQAATGQDANSSTQAPSFVNMGADDYHLTNASAGVDQGTSTEAPSADLENTARPQGAGFDIGAYEFCPSGMCTMGMGGSGGAGTGGNGTGGGSAGSADGGSGATGGAGIGGSGGSVDCSGGEGNCDPGADGCTCRAAPKGDNPTFSFMAALLGTGLFAARRRRRRHG